MNEVTSTEELIDNNSFTIPSLSFSFSWWQIALIFIVFIIILIILYKVFKKTQKDVVKNNDEYGSARFADEKELHATFDKEDLGNIQEFGFPIWFDKNLKYMLVDRQTPHWLFLGSTGSGKSLTSVKPQASMIANAKKKRSVFFTDPKGELFHDVAKVFQDNGYEVITLDFRNPTLSKKMNLLDPIISEWETYFEKKKEYTELDFERHILIQKYQDVQQKYVAIKDLSKKEELQQQVEELQYKCYELKQQVATLVNESMTAYGEAVRLVGTVSDMITAEENTKDPFFNASAGNLLAGLIFLFLERYADGEIKREQITLNSILKFQISTTEEQAAKNFKKLVADIPYDRNSKLRLTNVIGASENTYKSVTAVFGQKMNIFNDLNVANVTSESEYDFDVLGKGVKSIDPKTGEEITKPVAMFVIVRDEDESYNILVTLIVGLMYKCLVKLAVAQPKQRLPIDIVFMLDEFANCPPLPSISAMVTVARSRGMMFQFYIQEFSQLDKVYGKEVANIVKGNCGLVYLKTTSYETAELITKRLGKKTITQESFSRGIGFKETFGGNRSTSLTGRDVFTPDEVMNLEYKTIIFPIKKSNPIFRDTVPYFTFCKKYNTFYEGTIERQPYVLSQLEDKAYTFENIPKEEYTSQSQAMNPNFQKNRKRQEDRAERMLNRENNQNIMGEQDKNYLQPAMEKAKQILNDNFLSEEIKVDEESGRSYAEILTKSIIGLDKKKEFDKINENQSKISYVIQTSDDKTKTIIDIHVSMNPLLSSLLPSEVGVGIKND